MLPGQVQALADAFREAAAAIIHARAGTLGDAHNRRDNERYQEGRQRGGGDSLGERVADARVT